MSKVVLITGGASGFGAEIARQLVERGDRVVLVDRDVERGREVAGRLGGHFVQADVTSYDEVLASTAAAEQVHGALDAVCLNAGTITGCGVGEDFDPVLYRRATGVNLDGVVFGAHAAIPALRRRGGGAIVVTASMAALVGTPFDPVYGATKAAAVGLVRALGPALAPDGIRINAFCPGFADTPLIAPLREALEASGVPLLTPGMAARAVLGILDDGDTGRAWLLQAGLAPAVYRFRGVPGPRGADGAPVAPDDPAGIPPATV